MFARITESMKCDTLSLPCDLFNFHFTSTATLKYFPFLNLGVQQNVTYHLQKYTGWPRSHRTPRKYAPQTQYKFTMHSAARSTV